MFNFLLSSSLARRKKLCSHISNLRPVYLRGEIYWKLEETVSQGYRDTGSLAKRGRKASSAQATFISGKCICTCIFPLLVFALSDHEVCTLIDRVQARFYRCIHGCPQALNEDNEDARARRFLEPSLVSPFLPILLAPWLSLFFYPSAFPLRISCLPDPPQSRRGEFLPRGTPRQDARNCISIPRSPQ